MMVRSSMVMVIALLVVASVGAGLLIASLFGTWNAPAPPSQFLVTATSSGTVAGGRTETPMPLERTPESAPAGTAGAISAPSTIPPEGNMSASATVLASESSAVPATPVSLRTPTVAPTTTLSTAPALPTATNRPATEPAIGTPGATPAPSLEPTTIGQDMQFVEYVVQRGDTLYAIARLFNVSMDDILAYNNVPDPASLTIGQTLRIPAGDVTYIEYVVQRGDLLVTIAQRFGVSVDAILAINDVRNPSSLTVGQTLRIPRR